MGKQFYVIQLENDIKDLMLFLEEQKINIYSAEGKILTTVDELYNKRVVAVNTRFIPFSEDRWCANPPVEYCVPCPLPPEVKEVRFYYFDTPRELEIKKADGLKIINQGRFYLPNSFYDDEPTVAVFNTVKKYIRKNYTYSKRFRIYFSKAFVEEFKKGNVYASDWANVLTPINDI